MRYYGKVIVNFVDGTVEHIGGNRANTYDGMLVVSTTSSYGGPDRDVIHIPLVNVKYWKWDKNE